MTPTYVPDLVNTCLDLLIDRECGVWHLSNGDAMSWADLARRAAAAAGVPEFVVERDLTTVTLRVRGAREGDQAWKRALPGALAAAGVAPLLAVL